MVEMGRLCEEGYQQAGGGWRELAEDRGKRRTFVFKAGQKIGVIGPQPS